jgi:uncharacterized membrane protein YfcA
MSMIIGFALALLIGLSLGLLGGGGSILTVPVLHYVFAIGAHDAIAMSLVVVGLTSVVALVSHARAGRVKWRSGLSFGAASMVAAFAGARIGAVLPERLLVISFAGVMLVAGAAMLLRARRPAAEPARESTSVRIFATGIGVGLLTGILGAGGGFLIVPALAIAGRLPMREAVATSLLVIAMNSAAAVVGAADHASMDLGVLIPVLAIALAGSAIGVRLGGRISAQQLQRGFGWFVLVVATAILVRELV